MSDTLDLGTLVGYMKLDGSGWDRGITKGIRGIEGFKAKALLATAAIGGAAVGVGVALYKMGGVFDDVSDTIRADTGATGAELDDLVDSAKRVGTEVPASFSEISPVIADLHQRLGLTGPLLETLTKQFVEYGRISGESLDPTTVTAALNAFDVKGKNASKALDQLFRVSQATGVPLTSLVSSVQRGAPILAQFGFGIGQSANLLGNLDKAGINGDRTVQALSKAMVAFAKDGKEPRKALEDTITGIEDFIAKGDDAAATNLAAKIFGTRGAAQFVAAVKSGKLSVDALTASTFEHGDSILKAGEDTADFAEQWQLFKNRALVQIEPLASRVFTTLGDGMSWINSTGAPAIATLGDNFVDLGHGIGNVTAWLDDNQKAIVIVAGVITALLLPALIAWGVQSTIAGVKSVIAWTLTKIGAIESAGLQIMSLTLLAAGWVLAGVQATAGAIRVAAAWLIALGPIGWAIAAIALVVAVVIKYWDQISAFTSAAWSKISGAVSGAVSWIIRFVKAHWPMILAILTGPIGLAVLVVARHMEQIKSAIGGMISWARSVPGKLKSAFAGAFDGLKNAFRSAVNFIIRGWNSLSFKIPGFDPPGPGPKFGGMTIGVPKITPLAKGGFADQATLAEFGEAGPEVVLPLDDPKVKSLMADAFGGSGGGGGPVELSAEDRALLREMLDEFRQLSDRDITLALDRRQVGLIYQAGKAADGDLG